MQPAQLSLLADQVPAPAPMLLAQLPEASVAEAISLVGALIAKASVEGPTQATHSVAEVSSNE